MNLEIFCKRYSEYQFYSLIKYTCFLKIYIFKYFLENLTSERKHRCKKVVRLKIFKISFFFPAISVYRLSHFGKYKLNNLKIKKIIFKIISKASFRLKNNLK